MALFSLAFMLTLSSCDESGNLIIPEEWNQKDPGSSALSREDAEAKAMGLFAGSIRETEIQVEENGILTWKVDIANTSGAEAEIYFRQDDGSLFRIDGEKGPFGYNIEPGNNLISFQRAREIADARGDGALEQWRLRQEDSFNNQWVYTLEYDKNEVSLNGTDGSILEVKD